MASKLGEKRHIAFWRPNRCEVEGCTAKEQLKKCGGCGMVKYCGLEHQKQNWSKHKLDCSKLKEHGLVAKFYNVEDQLLYNPIGDLTLKDPEKKCGICGNKANKLAKTECCGNWVCDNEDEYQMFSFSRDFCSRSHSRYTLCSADMHKHDKKDWRVCKKCTDETTSVQDALWRGLNGYNFLPMLNVPYTTLTTECGKCKGRILEGMEAHSFSFTKDGPQLLCPKCMR